jgi:hypothetical protein
LPKRRQNKGGNITTGQLIPQPLGHQPKRRITKNKEYDFNVTRAIELLQEEGPTNIQNNLEDWKVGDVDDQGTIFCGGKQYVSKDQEL